MKTHHHKTGLNGLNFAINNKRRLNLMPIGILSCSLFVSSIGRADSIDLDSDAACSPVQSSSLGGNTPNNGQAMVEPDSASISYDIGTGTVVAAEDASGTKDKINCTQSVLAGGTWTQTFTYQKGSNWSAGGSLEASGSAFKLAEIKAAVEGQYGSNTQSPTSGTDTFTMGDVPACTKRSVQWKVKRNVTNFSVDCTLHCIYTYFTWDGTTYITINNVSYPKVVSHTADQTSNVGAITGTDKRVTSFNSSDTVSDCAVTKEECPSCTACFPAT